MSKAAVAIRDVLQTVPQQERSRDTLLTKVLMPFFRRLPRDVQTRLARDTMLDLAAAHILAQETLGEAGNVRLDGNECQIGTITASGDFDVLACGTSWPVAWQAFRSRMADVPDEEKS
jgi:hypothetical protein